MDDGDTYIPPPPMEVAGSGGSALQSTTGFFVSGLYLVTAALSVVTAVGSLLATLITALPLILGFLALTAVMLPWVKYHDNVLEEGEFFMRTQVYPVYRDTIRVVVDLVRDVFNPLICWWNAGNWWGYGMTREVLWPTIRDCGVTSIASNAATLLLSIVREAVIPLVTGRFMSEYSVWTETKPAGVAFANSWIQLYTCMCFDLGDILGVLPIINPLLVVPPAWGVLVPFSRQWADPQMWCALENTYNIFLAALREALRLIQQILLLISGQQLPSDPFIRPDFRDVAFFICEAVECFTRASENAWQLFWNKFIPFTFVFEHYFSIVDTLLCILVKSVALLLRVLINIDQCVLYPTNPFWETVIKKDVTEIINRWAEPTQYGPIAVPELPNAPRFNLITYRYDTAAEYTPIGDPNPVFGKRRVTEAVCIFITRTICDPSDTNTGCFSQGAQQLLMGLDFCCLTTNVLNTLADLVSGLFEFTLYLARGSDFFFLFVDAQPFTTHLKDDLVRLVRCILSVFSLIPVVGTCIRDLITGLIEWVLCMVDFFVRVVIGLATLPYYIIVLPGVPNFLQNANEALNFFVAANNKLIAETPSSVKNCITAILNEGFPVPPIPCATCTPSGFITPPAFKKRGGGGDFIESPANLLREVWGELSPDSPVFRITPLLRYRNHTTNPIKLYNMIMMNADLFSGKDFKPFISLRDVDNMVDAGKENLMKRWAKVKECNARTAQANNMRAQNSKLYEYHLRRGDFDCANPNGDMLPMMPPYGKPVDYGLGEPQSSLVRVGGVGAQQVMMMMIEKPTRLTLFPLENTTAGCDPTPPCFDLACIVRTSLDLIVLLLNILARFFNGLIQGSASLQGTMQDFPYFTGELCDLDQECFQSDITNLILGLFRPIKCLCQALNLIIPVTPLEGVENFTMGRPDICCAIQRISELLACIFQVLFNAIESIALGASDNFSYFRNADFRKDVNIIFDIVLEVVECLCIFLNAIFPLNFIPGFAAAVDFDPCCIPQALLNTITEIIRTLLQVIISLATITIDDTSVCYWRLDKTADRHCSGRVDDIGIIVQTDRIIDSFLPMHGEDGGACFANCANDNGSGGIVPCICQLFNTLIPFRRFPGMPVNCDNDPNTRNCQEVDFCCPFSKLGFFISDSLKFFNRAIVTLWQPWTNGLPEFFLGYIFCSEGQPPRCPAEAVGEAPGSSYQNARPTLCEKVANDQIPQCVGTHPVMDSMGNVHLRCGEFLCGRMHIIIKDLTDPFEGLLARCTCQFFGLLDRLIALLFRLVQVILPFAGWSCCFCGGLTPNGDCRVNGGYECFPDGSCKWIPNGPCDQGFDGGSSGVLTAISYVGQAVITAIVNFIRQFPLACYWKPFDPITQVSETWIFSFLGPTANSLCIAVGNLQCFAQSMFLLPQRCTRLGQRFLGSVLRWVSEVIFRVIGFIEAFVRSFIEEENTCIGPNCDAAAGSKEQQFKGIQQSNLGKMMVILLSIPIDLLIGDAEVACTTICPSFFAVPAPSVCGCWDRAPNYGNNLMGGAYEWTTNPAECQGMTSNNLIEHVGVPFANTTGCCKLTANALALATPPQGPLPACQSPDDADLPPDAVYYNATGPTLGFPPPGSCAVLGACRPDALPSCANDPMTPIFLSAGYTGAIDGLVMGLLRYLRCILSNIIGCDAMGNACTPLGLIFYPAMLIFSLSWQILGGVIRFLVATVLFFFSLFSPPEGDGCNCWEHVESTYQNSAGVGGTEVRLTRFYKRVAGLCYQCWILENQCGVPLVPAPRPDCIFEKRCADYCPVNQWLREPTIDNATAVARCITEYLGNSSKIMSTLTATEACSGVVGPRMYMDPDNPLLNCSEATRSGQQLCFPGTDTVGMGGSSPPCNTGFWGGEIQRFNMFQHDACPAPACQWQSPGYEVCGVAGVRGYWECPNAIFADFYPGSPFVTCGALQVIQNFLAVFDAFLAIFTTPLIVPPFNGGGLRSVVIPERRFGPPVRESRQQFNERIVRHQKRQATRYEGTIYGLTTGFPNMLEVMSDALYNYDTSDCWADPVACACRNLDMRDHCEWMPDGTIVWGHKRNGGGAMTTSELTMMLKEEKFCGTTVCDHIIGDCAGMDWNTTITADERNQWVQCLDKLVQGERLHQVNEVFPADFMYNPRSIQELSHNMYDGVKGYMARQMENARAQRVERPKRDTRARRNQNEEDLEEVEGLNQKFPNFAKELLERQQSAREMLSKNYNIHPHDLMYGAIVHADQLYYKYNRGYYGHMMRLATRNIMEGRYKIVPETSEALHMMRYAVNDLTHIIRHQPYQKMMDQTMEAARVISKYTSDVMEEGVLNHVRSQFTRYTTWRRSRFSEKEDRYTDQFVDKFKQGALFKAVNYTFYGSPQSEGKQETRYFASFRDHMVRTFEFQRTHWQNRSFNFFNADLKLWSAADILTSRWQNPVWTPDKLVAWESATRLYYQVYNRIWPGHLSREIQERFLFLSNCVVLDRALDVTTKVIDYCANEAMANARSIDTPDNLLFNYLRSTSPYRNNTYYGWRNRARFEERAYVAGDAKAWIRPRLIIANKTRNPLLDVDYRTYRMRTHPDRRVSPRNTSMLTDPYAHGPANFNFFSWLTRTFEDIFEFALGAQADSWFEEIQRFLTNPNTDIQDYPDVGLLYWGLFSFTCNFPENLNCSIGEGLETALLWSVVGFVGVVIVGAYVFPLVTVPFQILGYGITFFLVFMAIGFHTPLACMAIFPSFPLPVGVTIPQCAVDAIIEFADKWITNCYSPLLIPPYMIAGELCPTDPMQRIDVLNCRDVGVSDGIQNILFLGVQLFGHGFVDFMVQLGGTVLGSFIPGLHNYLVITLNDFHDASATQMERQWFCFYATLPTMVTPILFLFLAGLVGAVLVVPLVLLFNALVDTFLASPWGGVVPGNDDSAWVGPPPEVEPEPRRRPSKAKKETPSSTYMGAFMNLKQLFQPVAYPLSAKHKKE